VPRKVLADPATPADWKQKGWYANPGDPDEVEGVPFERVGPYLEPDGVTIVTPAELDPNRPQMGTITDETFKQPILLDKFGYPILYYAANTRYQRAKAGDAQIATFGCFAGTCLPVDPAHEKGVYTFTDNALFTGACGQPDGGGDAGTCQYPVWDFAGVGEEAQKLKFFGHFDPDEIEDYPDSFCYYILNKDIFLSTYNETTERSQVAPYRRDSFIMITPGSDGIYGTKDDVNNF
jgi:hypothetical protein